MYESILTLIFIMMVSPVLTDEARFTNGARHLLALRAGTDGDFTRVNGFLGSWRIDGDDLLTVRNRPLASFAETVSVAKSLNKPHRLRTIRPVRRDR